MIVDEVSNEEIYNEIINSNLSDKAKVKAIQALAGDKKIDEDNDDEEVVIND
jgi:hypothetical protein